MTSLYIYTANPARKIVLNHYDLLASFKVQLVFFIYGKKLADETRNNINQPLRFLDLKSNEQPLYTEYANLDISPILNLSWVFQELSGDECKAIHQLFTKHAEKAIGNAKKAKNENFVTYYNTFTKLFGGCANAVGNKIAIWIGDEKAFLKSGKSTVTATK